MPRDKSSGHVVIRLWRSRRSQRFHFRNQSRTFLVPVLDLACRHHHWYGRYPKITAGRLLLSFHPRIASSPQMLRMSPLLAKALCPVDLALLHLVDQRSWLEARLSYFRVHLTHHELQSSGWKPTAWPVQGTTSHLRLPCLLPLPRQLRPGDHLYRTMTNSSDFSLNKEV